MLTNTVMRKTARILFIFITLFFSINIYSQNLYFKHLGINDGLSQISIPSIYQDEYGVMWIGTTEGINRYNGISMIKRLDKNDENRWFNRNITKITGNKNGDLFFITGNNLIKSELKTFDALCIKDKVNDIFSEKDTLWIAASDGIYYYDGDKTNQFFSLKSQNNNTRFVSIYAKGQNIYAATTAGVYIVDRNNGRLLNVNENLNGTIRNIFIDSVNNIWVATWNGVYKIASDNGIEKFTSANSQGNITHNQARAILEDDLGNIWIGTYRGLDCYNINTGKWKHFIQHGESSNTLSHNSILSLYKDNNGNIWAGTYFGGISIFNPNPDSVNFYHSSSIRENWLNFNVVGEMAKDSDDNLWICTEGGGINILNLNSGEFRHLKHIADDFSTPGSNNLKSIYFDSESAKIYIGTHLGGLYVYDTKLNKGYRVKHNGLSNDIINKIIPYKNGLLLHTQSKGIVYMDTSTDILSELQLDDEARKILNKRYAYETIALDSRNRLWLGHANGVVTCVNLDNSHIEQYELDPIRKSCISYIYEDTRGEIYVCTLGSGLYHYINHKNVFLSTSLDSGTITNEYCYCICASREKNYLYVLHSEGLALFDAVNDKIIYSSRIFNQSYGHGSRIYRDENNLYIGGTNGLSVIKEKGLLYDRIERKIYFDRLFIYNNEITSGDCTNILSDVLSATKKLSLKHNQNNITFEISSYSYLYNINNSYEYKLHGFDNSWNISTSNRITYTNLPYGNYRLEVKSVLPEEISTTPTNSIDICITPPFYATSLAYIFYVIIVILVLGAVVAVIIRQTSLRTSLVYERAEKERIEDLNKMKINFFTSISHEIRTPLTLILGQIESLLHSDNISLSINNKLQKVYRNAWNLRTLITELLDFQKIEEGQMKLHIEEVEITNFIKQIYSSFIDYSKQKNINYHFSSSVGLQTIWCDPNQMQKVFSNIILNALKYTPDGGNVDISIKKQNFELVISVKDTGIGMTSEEIEQIFNQILIKDNTSKRFDIEGIGIGLTLAKNIIEMHHGSIHALSEKNNGSEFVVKLRLGNAHFTSEELARNNENSFVLPSDNTIDIPVHIVDKNIELEETPEKNDAKPHVLVVVDNEDLSSILNDILYSSYTLHFSKDLSSAFDMANEIHPDIIIAEMTVNDSSGKDLCYRIKNNIELNNISIILLTNDLASETVVEAFMAGADDCILKPFDVRVLQARCRNLIKNKKRIVAWCGDNIIPQTTEDDAISDSDRKLLKKCIDIIRENFENADFDVNVLANELCMGRSKLYNKFKQIVGMPPNEFIIKIKMEEAMNLIKENQELNISEISLKLGFSSPRYFSKLFKTFYGTTPQNIRRS